MFVRLNDCFDAFNHLLIAGNHGEDVKECYYYLDSTPTHSYMKALYKYPQKEYPYVTLVNENKQRTKEDREFELADTGKNEKISIITYGRGTDEYHVIRYQKQKKGCRDPGLFRAHANSPDLNQGPSDLQSDALPTELSRQLTVVFYKI